MEAGLPNIAGSISRLGSWGDPTSDRIGAFSGSSSWFQGTISGGNLAFYNNTLSLNASLSNSVFGNSSTVTPLSESVVFCIKH